MRRGRTAACRASPARPATPRASRRAAPASLAPSQRATPRYTLLALFVGFAKRLAESCCFCFQRCLDCAPGSFAGAPSQPFCTKVCLLQHLVQHSCTSAFALTRSARLASLPRRGVSPLASSAAAAGTATCSARPFAPTGDCIGFVGYLVIIWMFLLFVHQSWVFLASFTLLLTLPACPFCSSAGTYSQSVGQKDWYVPSLTLPVGIPANRLTALVSRCGLRPARRVRSAPPRASTAARRAPTARRARRRTCKDSLRKPSNGAPAAAIVPWN